MSALILRIIACLAMLFDHIGYITGNIYCRIIGRIAFPIFVYLITNGFRHTSNRIHYALRLALFALISQIPFSLFCYGTVDFHHGNVMFTLLLGLLCIWSVDFLRMKPCLRWIAFLPTLFICAIYYRGIISSDYGIKGILLTVVFYLFDGKPNSNRILMTVGALLSVFYDYFLSLGIAVFRWELGHTFILPGMTQWRFLQIFSLGALLFIFMYNGTKGKYPNGRKTSKLLQYGFYAFYPVHQVFLWIIRISL